MNHCTVDDRFPVQDNGGSVLRHIFCKKKKIAKNLSHSGLDSQHEFEGYEQNLAANDEETMTSQRLLRVSFAICTLLY